MDITIQRLSSDLAEDYISFFDNTPHDDNIDEHKCYCVCWCSENSDGVDFSSREKRRALANRYVKSGAIQGYLAYHGGKIVGWCNTNTKSECLHCHSWQRFMQHIPIEDPTSGIKVKSIFCYLIAPDMQRKGIASKLLEQICADAALEGFDFVEAYPKTVTSHTSSHFEGPIELYRKYGFTPCYEANGETVMRKALK